MMAAALLLTTIAASAPVIDVMQGFRVDGARAPRSVHEVVFEIGIAARDRCDSLDGRIGQRRPSEVGVNHDTGRVDDGAQRSAARVHQRAQRQSFDGVPGLRDVFAGRHPGTDVLGAHPERVDGRVGAVPRLELTHAVTLPQGVDTGNTPEIGHAPKS